MMLSGSRSRCDRRQSNSHRPVPLTHDAVITTPGRASCRMKPSTGSNSPDQGAAQVPWLRRDSLLPALPDPLGAEVDVLGVVLAIERLGQQAHDVHSREAAIEG